MGHEEPQDGWDELEGEEQARIDRIHAQRVERTNRRYGLNKPRLAPRLPLDRNGAFLKIGDLVRWTSPMGKRLEGTVTDLVADSAIVEADGWDAEVITGNLVKFQPVDIDRLADNPDFWRVVIARARAFSMEADMREVPHRGLTPDEARAIVTAVNEAQSNLPKGNS